MLETRQQFRQLYGIHLTGTSRDLDSNHCGMVHLPFIQEEEGGKGMRRRTRGRRGGGGRVGGGEGRGEEQEGEAE